MLQTPDIAHDASPPPTLEKLLLKDDFLAAGVPLPEGFLYDPTKPKETVVDRLQQIRDLYGIQPADNPGVQEILERGERIARWRRGLTKIGVGVVAVAAAGGLAAGLSYVDRQPQEAPPAPAAEQTPELPRYLQPAKLPQFDAVRIHYGKLTDTRPIDPQTQGEVVADVKGALQTLDTALKGKLHLGNVPITEDPQPYTPNMELKDTQAPGGSDSLLQPFITPDTPNTLNVVVVDDKDPNDITTPIAEAKPEMKGVIVYKPEKGNQLAIVHEFDHLLHYYHDQMYDTKVVGNTVTLAHDTARIEVGNPDTVMGNEARFPNTKDPDILSGYQLLRERVIELNQMLTVEDGKSVHTTIHAIEADNAEPKIVNMPISEYALDQSNSVMVELSGEGKGFTVKAYTSGESYIAEDEPVGTTCAIPLSDRQVGLGPADVNKTITINIGGEQIKLTVHKIINDPNNPSAEITIDRS